MFPLAIKLPPSSGSSPHASGSFTGADDLLLTTWAGAEGAARDFRFDKGRIDDVTFIRLRCFGGGGGGLLTLLL
jgi:hypothetical protein